MLQAFHQEQRIITASGRQIVAAQVQILQSFTYCHFTICSNNSGFNYRNTTQCPALTSQVYSISAVTNASTYTWLVPTGWTITSGAGTISINVTTGAAGQNGNITVTAGNSCGTSTASSLAVSVNPGYHLRRAL